MGALLPKIAKTVAKTVKQAGIDSPMTLIKVAPGTRTAGALSGGTNPTETPYRARGIESEYTAYELANSLAKVGDRRIRLFGASIAGKQIPEPNDKVISQRVIYRIIGPVGRDPASATYLCQCRSIGAYAAPTAMFASSPSGLVVTFTGGGSATIGGIVSWAWTFGDGGTSTAQSPTHTYTTGGTYTVTLTVRDGVGGVGQHTATVTLVGNQPPVASFSASLSNLIATFTDASTDSDGSVVAWSWDFGDSISSTLQNPVHTYAVAGTYAVTLTATDNLGATGSHSANVSPALPPIPMDGPGGLIKVPTLAAQWPLINAAIPTPSWHFPCQEASGNLVDVLNGFQLVKAGAGTQANTLASWSTKFLGTTEIAAQCFASANATGDLWNVFTQSVFLYGLVHFASSSGTRRWFVINGVTYYLEILVNGHIRLNGGTAGLLSHVGANVRPFVVEVIAGLGVTGHSGPGLFRFSSDIEQITGTWSQQPDSSKGWGPVSAAAAAPPVMNGAELWGWQGSDAEACSALGPKTFIQSTGFAVSGY